MEIFSTSGILFDGALAALKDARGHGHRHYNSPNVHADVAFDTLLPHLQQPLGPSYSYRLYQLPVTKLRPLPVTKFRPLQKQAVDTKQYVPNSPDYKLVAIILDVATFRWYKPVQTVSLEETPTRDFLKLDFRNKGLDAVNISNIMSHKKVTSRTRAPPSSPTVILLPLQLKFSITKTCCKV